jgi:hypothetical protein
MTDFWKNPRDTHFMNIADMLPYEIKNQFLKDTGHEEYIEPEILSVGRNKITPKMLVDAVVEYDDWDDDGNNSLDQLPENFLKKSLNSKILSAAVKSLGNNGDVREALKYFPIETFKPSIKKLLIDNDSDSIYYIPTEVLTPKDVVYALKRGPAGSRASDYLDELESYETESGELDWDSIIPVFSHYLPHIDNKEVQNVLTDIVNSKKIENKKADDEFERTRPEREERQRIDSLEREKLEQQKLNELLKSLDTNPENLSKIPPKSLTPDIIKNTIDKHPNAIFHLSADQRKKEYWLLAINGKPSLIELVRPFELQAEIKNELSVNEDIEKIKQLSGL